MHDTLDTGAFWVGQHKTCCPKCHLAKPSRPRLFKDSPTYKASQAAAAAGGVMAGGVKPWLQGGKGTAGKGGGAKGKGGNGGGGGKGHWGDNHDPDYKEYLRKMAAEKDQQLVAANKRNQELEEQLERQNGRSPGPIGSPQAAATPATPAAAATGAKGKGGGKGGKDTQPENLPKEIAELRRQLQNADYEIQLYPDSKVWFDLRVGLHEQLESKLAKLDRQVQNPSDRSEAISRQLAGLERKRKKADEGLVQKDKQHRLLGKELLEEAAELKRIKGEIEELRAERITLDQKKTGGDPEADAVQRLQPVQFVASLREVLNAQTEREFCSPMVKQEAEALAVEFESWKGSLERFFRWEAHAKSDTEKRADDAAIERKKWADSEETRKLQLAAEEKATRTASAPNLLPAPAAGSAAATAGRPAQPLGTPATPTAQGSLTPAPAMPVWQDDLATVPAAAAAGPAAPLPTPTQAPAPAMPVWQDDMVTGPQQQDQQQQQQQQPAAMPVWEDDMVTTNGTKTDDGSENSAQARVPAVAKQAHPTGRWGGGNGSGTSQVAEKWADADPEATPGEIHERTTDEIIASLQGGKPE